MQLDTNYFAEALEKSVKNELRNARWTVYEQYALAVEHGETFVIASPPPIVFVASRSNEQTSVSREGILNSYSPLSTPELVVELAELAEAEITPEEALGWAETYGLLGISEDDLTGPDELPVPFQYRKVGGRESVLRFAKAAREVRACLRAYEALTSEEEVDSEHLSALARDWPVRTHDDWELVEAKYTQRSMLFSKLARTVQIRLVEHCYPLLRNYTHGGFPTGRFTLSWGFNNLLGAIWLQMAWLLEAEGERVRRCKLPGCLRVIHFEPGHDRADSEVKKNARGKYKTRVDREFCKGRGCKQKYHYRKKAGWSGYN